MEKGEGEEEKRGKFIEMKREIGEEERRESERKK